MSLYPRVMEEGPALVATVDPGLHGCAIAMGSARIRIEETRKGLGLCYTAGTLLACRGPNPGFLKKDPGLLKAQVDAHACGDFPTAHQGEGGPLVWAATVMSAAMWLRGMFIQMSALAGPHRQVLVLEVPQLYPGDIQTNPNDLIQLNAINGGLATAMVDLGVDVVGRYPREWTKQVRKEIRHEHLKREMPEVERQIVEAEARHHNEKKQLDLWDAVGLLKTPGWWLELFPRV